MKALYDLSKQERNNNKQRRRLSSTQMILDNNRSSSSNSRRKKKAAVEQSQQAPTTTAAALEDDHEIRTHDDDNLCSFCKRVPPAVNIQVPAIQRQSDTPVMKPYCLTCYYTTGAIRLDKDKYVSVCMVKNDEKDGSSTSLSETPELDKQLPGIQQLFSEAFLELQQELSDESIRAFRQQKSDPLASLLSSGGGVGRNKKKNKRSSSLEKPPPPAKNPKGDNNDESAGGFLRSVPMPERLLKVQQQQAQVHAQQLARMNKAAAGGAGASSTSDATSSLYNHSSEASSSSVYKRRKASRQSIWNLAMDPATEKALQDAKMSGKANSTTTMSVPPCTCGSTNVIPFGNITSRNQDLRKGEIWGGKDRSDDVVTRYRCNQCGKTWNEES